MFKKEGDDAREIKSFQPLRLNGEVAPTFNSLAAPPAERDSRFSLHPAAKKSLGIEKEELQIIETRIASEVNVRVEFLKKDAFDEGFAQGKKEVVEQALSEFKTQTQPEYERFVKLIAEFEGAKEAIFQSNEQFLIQLIFQVAREVALKELKTDREYVKRLCAQLIEKVGVKDYVKIKIGHEDYANVDSIRDYLKHQFVDLKNIQIEPSDEVISGGCKIETDLCKVNATVDTQLALIHQTLGET